MKKFLIAATVATLAIFSQAAIVPVQFEVPNSTTGSVSSVTLTNAVKITGKVVSIDAISSVTSTATVRGVTGVGSVVRKTLMSSHAIPTAGVTTNVTVYLSGDLIEYTVSRGAATNDGLTKFVIMLEE